MIQSVFWLNGVKNTILFSDHEAVEREKYRFLIFKG